MSDLTLQQALDRDPGYRTTAENLMADRIEELARQLAEIEEKQCSCLADLATLTDECWEDSCRWFPEVHRTHMAETIHFALGLAGETGEAVDHVKKANRNGWRMDDARASALGQELADVLMYTLLLARSVGVDIGEHVDTKRALNEERFEDSADYE